MSFFNQPHPLSTGVITHESNAIKIDDDLIINGSMSCIGIASTGALSCSSLSSSGQIYTTNKVGLGNGTANPVYDLQIGDIAPTATDTSRRLAICGFNAKNASIKLLEFDPSSNPNTEYGVQLLYDGGSNRLRLLSGFNVTQGVDFSNEIFTIPRDLGANRDSGLITVNRAIESLLSVADNRMVIGTASNSSGNQSLTFKNAYSSNANTNGYVAEIAGASDNNSGGRIVLRTTSATAGGPMNDRLTINALGNVIIPGGVYVGSNAMVAISTGLGLGLSPNASFQLDLSSDNARKLTSTTWSTGSDSRIKKNVVSADYDLLYSIVKNIDLKYFEWDYQNDEINSTIKDKHSIGFIAQEVKQFYPKAVEITDETERFNIPDFHNLNVDQLNKAMYGALKKAINKIELLEERIKTLEDKH